MTDLTLELLAYCFLSAAAVGRIWAGLHLAGKRNTVLVTSGPYSLIRHPLYAFSLLGFLGAGFAFESFTLAFTMAAVFFATHWSAMRREDEKLRELHGERFEKYESETPRLIPHRFFPQSPRNLNVASHAMHRIINESAMVMTIFLAAHIIEAAHVHSYLPVLVYLP